MGDLSNLEYTAGRIQRQVDDIESKLNRHMRETADTLKRLEALIESIDAKLQRRE